MREYETVFVLHPSMDEQEVEAEIQAVQDLITKGQGTIEEVERWGRRRLAYEIQKAHEGTYTLIRYKADPPVLKEIERRFRLNERLLRYLTVLSEGPPAPPRSETEEPRERRRDDGDFEIPRRHFGRDRHDRRSDRGPSTAPPSQPKPEPGAEPKSAEGTEPKPEDAPKATEPPPAQPVGEPPAPNESQSGDRDQA